LDEFTDRKAQAAISIHDALKELSWKAPQSRLRDYPEWR
jgi:hypothetical protein